MYLEGKPTGIEDVNIEQSITLELFGDIKQFTELSQACLFSQGQEAFNEMHRLNIRNLTRLFR